MTKHNLVVLARIGRPHGVRGALHIDQAGAHLGHFIGRRVFVGNTEQAKEITLQRAENTTVQFEGFSDRDKAAALTNQLVLVPLNELKEIVRRERKTPVTTMTDLWYFELIGLNVVDESSGEQIGKIKLVEDLGRNTLVTIEPGPAIPAGPMELPLDCPCWQKVDLSQERVEVRDWRQYTATP